MFNIYVSLVIIPFVGLLIVAIAGAVFVDNTKHGKAYFGLRGMRGPFIYKREKPKLFYAVVVTQVIIFLFLILNIAFLMVLTVLRIPCVL